MFLRYHLLKFSLLATLCGISASSSIAQGVSLKYVEIKDSKIAIHYALLDSVVHRSYSVRVYSSRDNFLNPLEMVSGDVGLEVKPGNDNVVLWDARSELDSLFDDKVSLEIRARIFIPFINTESIDQNLMYKRKRIYNIDWTGGTPQNILNFDLYRGARKIISFPNLANVGHYALEFPGYVRPGKNYRLRISDTKNRDDVVFTSQFRIKRKVPLILKLIPALGAGAAIYFVLGINSHADNGIPDPPTNFPAH